jgi:hypothetical protein
MFRLRSELAAFPVGLRFALGALFLLLAWGSARADEFERVLVPVYVDTVVPGAFGSSWTSDLWILNRGESVVTVATLGGPDCRLIVCSGVRRVDPGELVRFDVFVAEAGLTGVLLHTWREQAGDLQISLRIRDTSRRGLSAGTSVPVVRESELRTDSLILLDVPVDPMFRTSLRLYAPFLAANDTPVNVRVRAVRMNDQRPAFDVVATLRPWPAGDPSFPAFPGFAMLQDLGGLIADSGDEPLALYLEALTLGTRFWAMATTTHNESQVVTAIVPD